MSQIKLEKLESVTLDRNVGYHSAAVLDSWYRQLDAELLEVRELDGTPITDGIGFDNFVNGLQFLAVRMGRALLDVIDWEEIDRQVAAGDSSTWGVFTYDHVELSPACLTPVNSTLLAPWLFGRFTREGLWSDVCCNFMAPTIDAAETLIREWAEIRGIPVKPQAPTLDAAQALDSIQQLMSGEAWSPATLDDIRDILLLAGREVKDLGESA